VKLGARRCEGESGSIYTFARTLAYAIVNVCAMKMVGVFMMTTSTLAIRIGIFPRWMAFLGYAPALLLLLSKGTVAGVGVTRRDARGPLRPATDRSYSRAAGIAWKQLVWLWPPAAPCI
jgi:hypothetical protein